MCVCVCVCVSGWKGRRIYVLVGGLGYEVSNQS